MPKPSSTAPPVPPCLSPESAPAWARLLNYVRHTQRRTLLVIQHDSPRLPRELPPLLAAETGRPLAVATVSDAQPDPMAATFAAAPNGQFAPGTILTITGAEDLAVASPDQSSVAALHEFARRLDLRRDQLLPEGGIVLVWATARVFEALAEHALNFISRASAVLTLVAAEDTAPITQTGGQVTGLGAWRGNYRIPPLPADAPEELRAALVALEELAVADELYLQGGAKIAHALARFDAARDQIEAGWEAAHRWSGLTTPYDFDTASNNAVRDFAGALIVAFAYVGRHVLTLRLHPLKRITWFEAAIAAARRRHDRAAEGVMLGNLGIPWAELGDTHKAISFYEQQLVITREIEDRRGQGTAFANLGLAWADLGDGRKAIGFYEQALAIAREFGDLRGVGSTLNNLGLIWAGFGDVHNAISHYEQALVVAREIGDRRGESNALGNIGLALATLGDARKAIGFYEQALVIVREIGYRRGEEMTLGFIGDAQAALGDTKKAIDFYEQALTIAREIGDRNSEAHTLFNSARSLDKLGRRSEAITRAEQAATIYAAIKSPALEKARQLATELRREWQSPA